VSMKLMRLNGSSNFFYQQPTYL